jgi:hypothetical protein
MDENTKHIVASNLTVAYFSTLNRERPIGTTTALTLVNDAAVFQVYLNFLAKLKLSKT